MSAKKDKTKATKTEDTKESPAVADIDEETLDVARNIIMERKMKESARKKFKARKKGFSDLGVGDAADLLDLLKSNQAARRRNIVNGMFARTVEDTVLSNTFVQGRGGAGASKSSKRIGHITLRKAKAMDGLRDVLDIPNSEVGVDDSVANTMNPEGRYLQPTLANPKISSHPFAKRFREAMDPRNSEGWDIIPEEILRHFSAYSTFIGYPLCSVLGLHPTISNACSIPAEDAVAPGYKLSFVESEDLNNDGVPDDLEVAELGGVKMSLARMRSMEALKGAINHLANSGRKATTESDMVSLANALERLVAYEEWERHAEGGGENSAEAIREGLITPLSEALSKVSNEPGAASRKEALTTLSLALADLSKREHMDLTEVRATIGRRDASSAIEKAVDALSEKKGTHDESWTLNLVAVALERIVAYKDFSDDNARYASAMTTALAALANRGAQKDKDDARETLRQVRLAMDSGEFAFAPHEGAVNPEEGEEVVPPEIGQVEQPQENQMATPATPQISAGEEDEKKKIDEEQQLSVQKAKIAQERQRLLDQWHQRATRMGLDRICRKIIKNSRMFGIGIALPIVENVDYEEPFDISKVKMGAYKGFTVVEPTWIYPETDSNDLINPMSPNFFEPTYWVVTGSSAVAALNVRRIHQSWLIIHRHKEVPDMLRPMYYYGGVSLTQEIYEAVFAADKLMNEVPKLAMTKRTTVVKGDPTDLVMNPEGVIERLQAYSQVQDNFGILFLGRNADIQKMETSFADFDQVIAKANQKVASIAQIPETKLFKTQLAGMNSAGRYEWDDYSQLLINYQNNVLKPLLDFHYRLDSKSQTGKAIAIKIDFNAIDVPTKAEKEESESRGVQTLNSAIQGGWLARSEARILARAKEGSTFSSISAEMPEELIVQNQQQDGMQPDGVGGGNPLEALLGKMKAGGGEEEPPAPDENDLPGPEMSHMPEGTGMRGGDMPSLPKPPRVDKTPKPQSPLESPKPPKAPKPPPKRK